MGLGRVAQGLVMLVLMVALAGCGGRMGSLFGGSGNRASAERMVENEARTEREISSGTRGSIWDLFTNREDPNTQVNVNRYIWTAALEVLDFLPVETVDPFSGVFTTGFGTPPGGGRPYRATVHVTDAALDARSLNLALITRAGPASPDTVRAVENAILNRARQLRIRDRGL
jgi:hypothetical protein